MPRRSIMESVSDIYGADTGSPERLTVSPCSIRGAAMSSAETNCDDTVASTVTSPPLRRLPLTRSGGYPSRPRYSISAPQAFKAVTSGSIGRSAMRPLPESTARHPSRAATKAVRNRMAVPQLSTLISTSSEPAPASASSARRITAVSAQSGHTGEGAPGVMAASTSARFATDFDSGTSTSPSSISSSGPNIE